MAPFRRPFGLLLLALLIASVVVAQEEDVEGSKDHPLISRYPGSSIVAYDSKKFDEFQLPLGRATDDETLTKTQSLEGKVTRIAYSVPEGRSIVEVFRNFDNALTQAGFSKLFTCRGVEQCGPLFETLRHGFLSGASQPEQRCLSARLARPEGDVYVSLAVSESTILLTVVEVKPMETGLVTVDAKALAGDLARTGHVAVYGIYFDTGKADVKPESKPALDQIAALLKQDPKLKLYVVGHTDTVGDLAMNMDLSRRRAQAVLQALTGQYGIAAARLKADGVGPLAPVASNETEEGRAKNRRVELVKQ